MAKGKYEKWLLPEGLILVEGWARDGLTEDQIAHNMGIHRDTLNEWKKKYPVISDTLKKGKEVVDFEVENALLKRALGFKTEETISEVYADGKKHVKKIVRDVPPDTTAAIFWLKNRKPDKWKNKPIVVEKDEYEDDGLLKALDSINEDLFADGDDSYMIEQEDE